MKIAGKTSLKNLALAAALAVPLALSVQFAGPSAAAQQTKTSPSGANSPYIDVHSHMDISNPERSVESAIGVMALSGARKLIFMPSPFSPDDKVKFEAQAFIPALKPHPDKFAWLAGGGSLNIMIQQAVDSHTDSDPAVQKKFHYQAEKLLSDGAVGFGELSAEHVPSATSPSYSAAPPDSPLFMILADIAAQHDVPIILHMEAVPQDMPLPSDLKSPPMPKSLKGNIAPFERLLAHNPRANFVWSHAGSTDNYGTRTPELCRRLLAAHPNLYMEIKVDMNNMGKNALLDASGKLKPEWLKLFEDFSTRFVIGSDQNYPPPQLPATIPQRWQAIAIAFNQLPPALRKKIGLDNPTRLYFGKRKNKKS